jgi:hypothetical protein
VAGYLVAAGQKDILLSGVCGTWCLSFFFLLKVPRLVFQRGNRRTFFAASAENSLARLTSLVTSHRLWAPAQQGNVHYEVPDGEPGRRLSQ